MREIINKLQIPYKHKEFKKKSRENKENNNV